MGMLCRWTTDTASAAAKTKVAGCAARALYEPCYHDPAAYESLLAIYERAAARPAAPPFPALV